MYLMSQLFPLLPVLVDHPDVVVDVRTSLPVVDVRRIVRPLRRITPEAKQTKQIAFLKKRGKFFRSSIGKKTAVHVMDFEVT